VSEHSGGLCTPDNLCDACADKPISAISHITWIALDGSESESFIPWHTQAAPGLVTGSLNHEYRVHTVHDVGFVNGPSIRFIVCREVDHRV
jgi:hypothetical protein